ncbi:uncharacterized protein TNCT_33471 [Trichonephila clavata]|uniref:Integrase zinc-binding domain-containing protein n=1 Tax=Trichonephila clavata TaxID=2740835 RepID=A0A8X6EZV5_TRICU|nr:uncharacterized protein TNCT_33471 [Trichonephila clavata]
MYSEGGLYSDYSTKEIPTDAIECEKMKTVVFSTVTDSNWIGYLLPKYSSFQKLLRVVAWCLRFVNNLRSLSHVQTRFLYAAELNQAHSIIIVHVQREVFFEKIQTLERKGQVSSQSKLVMLHPFLDDERILRVGGRLRNVNVPKSTKHPIVLPKSHYITELVVRHYHHKYLHGGSELILSALRMQYWIISARTVVRKVIRKCVACFRHKNVFSQQLMGDLPVSRVNPGRAFSKSGVDFAGPFQVKPRRGRGSIITAAVILDPQNLNNRKKFLKRKLKEGFGFPRERNQVKVFACNSLSSKTGETF